MGRLSDKTPWVLFNLLVFTMCINGTVACSRNAPLSGPYKEAGGGARGTVRPRSRTKKYATLLVSPRGRPDQQKTFTSMP